MNRIRSGVRPFLAIVLLGSLSQAGCVTRWFGLGEPKVEGAKGSVTLAQLERLVDGFAERQVTLVADACESIKRESPDSPTRRRAQHMKLANGTAIYDIVSQPDLLGRVADLYTLIELQYLVWVKEGRAAKRFDKITVDRLTAAAEEARRGMSEIADLAMKPKRRAHFDDLIRRWRERNPDVDFVSGIRFGALTDAPGKSILESASSFFDVINPMEDTTTSVEHARVLGDRAFFYSKRILKLTHWQLEAAFEDTLAKPEVRQVLADVERAVSSVERISRTIEEMPERNKEFVGTVREIRGTVVDARELAVRATEAGKSFEQTFRELRQVVEQAQGDPADPPGRPFDIREYTEAAAQLQKTARDGAGLIAAGEGLVDRIAWAAALLLVLLFGLLLGTRLLAARWLRPKDEPRRHTEIRRPPTGWEARNPT